MNYPQQGFPQSYQPQPQQGYGAPPAAPTPQGYGAPPGYVDPQQVAQQVAQQPQQPPAAANPWATPPAQMPQPGAPFGAAPGAPPGAPPMNYQQQPQQPQQPQQQPQWGPPPNAQPQAPGYVAHVPGGYPVPAPAGYGQPPPGYAPPQPQQGHHNPFGPSPQSQGYADVGASIAGAQEGATRYGALPHGGGTATHDVTILRSSKPQRTDAIVFEVRVDASSCVMPGAVHSIFQYIPLADDKSDKANKQRSDTLRLIYRLNGLRNREDAEAKGFTAQHVIACYNALIANDPGPFAGRRYRVQVTKSKKPGKNGEHYPNAEFMEPLA